MLIDVLEIETSWRSRRRGDLDGDLDVVEDLRCPPMEIKDLELDRVPIKDESRSDRCSPV